MATEIPHSPLGQCVLEKGQVFVPFPISVLILCDSPSAAGEDSGGSEPGAGPSQETMACSPRIDVYPGVPWCQGQWERWNPEEGEPRGEELKAK